MNSQCQECKQPLLLQPSQPSILADSYVNLQNQTTSEVDKTTLDDHSLYFFGLSGDAAELSFQAEKELRIRDLIEAKPQGSEGGSSIQLKYPVCFDCFELIINGMN